MIAPFLVPSLFYVLTSSNARSAPEQSRLTIAVITPSNASSASPGSSATRGVRLGAAEAKQTASLFGGDIDLLEANAGRSPVVVATELLSRRQVQVLIGTSPDDAEALSRFAESRRILFFNIASRAQALRRGCRRFTFHVEATDAMYANAARWPVAGGLTTGRDRPAPLDSVVLWDLTLQRYGASQINDRYGARFGVGMDGAAWAGWVAVKIAAEAALRARSSDPSRLLAYLESPTAQFDGHKGWPLTFRTAEHQLRQPLYVVRWAEGASSPARELRDVPDLRALSSGTEKSNGAERPNQVLDRLIASPTAPRCSWAHAQ